MADPDYIFMDGFDHYYPISTLSIRDTALAQQYLSGGIHFTSVAPIAPLTGGLGYGMNFTRGSGNNGTAYSSVSFPANYARTVGGFTWKMTSNGIVGVIFRDVTTDQITITLDNATGKIAVRRGGFAGTVLATSTETMLAESIHCIEWDITFHATTGIVKIWIDGTLSSIDLSSQDTNGSANNYFNDFCIAGYRPTNTTEPQFHIDHLYVYCYTASGGSETPLLTNPIILTDFPNSDDTSDFTASQTVLGTTTVGVTTASGALGANRTFLNQITCPEDMTLDSVNFQPNTTSAIAKFKAVLYSDNAGVPDVLLGTGTEVVASTAGTVLNLPFSPGIALTGGTTYWMGFITDTSVAAYRANLVATAEWPSTYFKASTYASGPLSPAGSTWAIIEVIRMYGLGTGSTDNYVNVNDSTPTSLNSNVSATVGNKDYFGFPGLSVAPNEIYCVAVRVNFSKSDGGSRTAKINLKSNTTESDGTADTITPALSQQYYTSYYLTDPDTGLAWDYSGASSSKGGYEVAS